MFRCVVGTVIVDFCRCFAGERRRVRNWILANVAACVLPVLVAPCVMADSPEKPNIVFIMADELGYYELSCMGHPYLKTPHIDRMAAEGLRFTQALAGSSVCAPTRCVLMTGKHSGHTSVRSNGGGTPLRAGEATIASVLKQAGYATGGYGKWGCGGRGSTGVPEQHGFDEFIGYYDQVHAHSYFPAYIIRNSRELKLPGNRGGRQGETYAHYPIFDAAKSFIRKNSKRPFFCYLPVTPPHGMFDIPDSDPAWQLYRDRPWPEDARRYAAMISMLDRQVGEVFELLRTLGIDQNTIVFFCGDNGGNDYFSDAKHTRGFHAPNVDPRTEVDFRGKKGTLYEGGLRIPMIVRWPGKISARRVSDLLWYFPDVMPTLAELAQAKLPGDIDGISIVPELLGPGTVGREQRKHEYLYWELGRQTAVRNGQWKAIQTNTNRSWELYDLSRDVSERNDVAAAHADVVARLTKFARQAHTPVVEGTFADQADHQRDRQAKWGDRRPPAAGRVQHLPRKGLIPNRKWKVVRASSESKFNGKLAVRAIDGNPRTIWHSRWQGELAKPPHELVIDLGDTHTIRGFRYLARQDGGWNGTVAKCEFSVAAEPDGFGAPAATATFRKLKQAQEVKCAPVSGRFVRFRALSEVNGGPWASVAELGVVGK